MTNPVNSSDASQSNSPAVGVPETSVGLVLQRGGEELGLEKVSDRFTLRLSENREVSDVMAQLISLGVPTQHSRTVPQSNLDEFVVDNPERLDWVMMIARALEGVEFASHVYQVKNNPQMNVFLGDQVTVQFVPELEAEKIQAIAQEVGLEPVAPLEGVDNAFIFKVSDRATENPIKIANRLISRPDVLVADPNIIFETQQLYRPSDSLYSKQWYLHNNGGSLLATNSDIDVESAWDITRGNRSVVVAVADDSIDLNHPDFQGIGKIVAPKNFKENNFLPLPEKASDNHGTACAGIAIAEETGTGIVGVAPGCALMPLRTTGYLDDQSIDDLFDWAITKGAAVISCSWGPSAVYFPLSLRQKAAINRAATKGRNGKGCVIVFAAGNANRPLNGEIDEKGWPRNILSGKTSWLGGFTVHPDIVVVSACTSLNKKSAYSNWGLNVSVCAPSNNAHPGMWLQETGYINTQPTIQQNLPGLGVFTTDRVGDVGYEAGDFTSYFGGTSSACPVVAGVAALVLSVNPDLTAVQVKQILQQSADKIVDSDADPQLGFKLGTYDKNGHSQWFGYGKVNAYKAVKAAQQMMSAPLQVTRSLSFKNDTVLQIPDAQRTALKFSVPNFPGERPQQGITSPIMITETNLVQDITITIEIEHNFMGDIEVYLIAPNGRTVLLQNRTLGNATKLQKSYSVRTLPTLRQLLNQSAKGNWQLWVVDRAVGDTGALKRWELTLGV